MAWFAIGVWRYRLAKSLMMVDPGSLRAVTDPKMEFDGSMRWCTGL